MARPDVARRSPSLALDPITVDAPREYIKRWDDDRAAFEHSTYLLFCWPDGRHIHPDTIIDWFQQHAAPRACP